MSFFLKGMSASCPLLDFNHAKRVGRAWDLKETPWFRFQSKIQSIILEKGQKINTKKLPDKYQVETGIILLGSEVLKGQEDPLQGQVS